MNLNEELGTQNLGTWNPEPEPGTLSPRKLPHGFLPPGPQVRRPVAVRHRGFTVVAALVLAFGIGANTAVFTLINSLVLKPRTGASDAELAGVFSRDRTQADAYRAFSYPNYATFATGRTVQSLTAHNFALLGLTEGTVTKRVFADVIVSNYFDTFGVSLSQGRPFTLEERNGPGADHAGGDSQLRDVAAARRHGCRARLHREDQRPPVQRGRRRASRLRRIDGDRLA